jgi:hypothetical protein
MKNITMSFFLLLYFSGLTQPDKINIADNTLKIGTMSEEIFYYAFAEGDQIIFSFNEQDGKELKEVEITEYPSNSRFMAFKTAKIENKSLMVQRTGIYVFRLKNGALFGRICQIKIERLPGNEKTKMFNTAVKWVERPDTTWNVYTREVVVGYDTVRIQKTKKELVESKQTEEHIMTKSQRVHSESSAYGSSRTSLSFSLPEDTWFGMTTKKVVSWAYWVGVGEESDKAWKQNCKIMTGLVTGVANYALTPLGGLLAGKVTELVMPKVGEDVSYGIVNGQNREFFLQGLAYKGFDSGKGIAGYKKFTNDYMLQGTWHIILSNDNVFQAIDVDVKVVALIETNTYEHRPYIEQKVSPRYENKVYKEPAVEFKKVPVTMQ